MTTLADQASTRLRTDLGLDMLYALDYNVTQVMASQALPFEKLNTFIEAHTMFSNALLLNLGAEPANHTGTPVTNPLYNESVLADLYPGCSLPANLSRTRWPLRMQHHDKFDWQDDPSLKVPADPYERAYKAYYEWCNPIMCSKVTKKTTYLRTIQGMAAVGGLWGIVTLAILVLWQCLFLGCVNGHQQQKASTQAPLTPRTTYHTAFSSFVGVGFVPGIGSVHGPTPVNASVEIEPQAQSMDRDLVADRV
jgi:hypothetical protein